VVDAKRAIEDLVFLADAAPSVRSPAVDSNHHLLERRSVARLRPPPYRFAAKVQPALRKETLNALVLGAKRASSQIACAGMIGPESGADDR
jgi:hypothetical protein